MALFTVKTGTAAMTANATAGKSFWLLNPAGNEMVITEFAVSVDSVAVFAVELYRVTTLGSPAGTTTTPAKCDVGSQAADTTSLTVLSTEVTAVEIIKEWNITGLLHIQVPLGREIQGATAGARLGLRYVTGSIATTNYRSFVEFSE